MDHSFHHHNRNMPSHDHHDMLAMAGMNHHDMSAHNMGGHMMHMGNLKQKFFISLLLAIPILLLSLMMGKTLAFQFSFTGSDWLVFIFASICFSMVVCPFYRAPKWNCRIKILR